MKDTWQTFFRVIVRIMKKGYSRQHPGAAIVFVGKGGISEKAGFADLSLRRLRGLTRKR